MMGVCWEGWGLFLSADTELLELLIDVRSLSFSLLSFTL